MGGGGIKTVLKKQTSQLLSGATVNDIVIKGKH
jgi:hypothetical protein